MMRELSEWLIINKLSYKIIDHKVIEIAGFGKMYFEDTHKMQSIFRKDNKGNLLFNSTEYPQVLINKGINYTVFKFGNNFYFTDLRKEFKLTILKYIGKKVLTKHTFNYVNLGVHTSYELLNGSFAPKAWIEKALFCEHPGIGICDRNTMAACYNLQKECENRDMKFVFGYSLDFVVDQDKIGAKVYVQSQEGLINLLRIQKAIMVDSDERTIQLEELLNRGEGNIIVLDKYSSYWIKENKNIIEDLQRKFIKVLYQVDLSEYKSERIDNRVLYATKLYFDEIYSNNTYHLSPILLSDCYYLDKEDAKNKIILNKIASGIAHEQSDEQYYKDVDEQYILFEQLFDNERWNIADLFRECCDNTIYILENAKARFDTSQNFMPNYKLTLDELHTYGTAHNMFIQLLDEGFKRLVPKEKEEKYRKQMEYEKYIIESTNNVDYLLIQYDTCNWARKNGIVVGCGRGSSAGSLLLYLLGITLIDPIKYDLIFERFLLPERAGLYSSDVTIISREIRSKDFVEVTFENDKTLKIAKESKLLVKRKGNLKPIIIYASELEKEDDLILDNRDLLFTINELYNHRQNIEKIK